MANPQTENGYTRIANEILDHITRINLSGNEFRIIMVIWRKTYGYSQKTSVITNKEMQELSGLSKSRVSQVISKLESYGMINSINFIQGKKKRYAFVKDYHKWQQYHKSDTVRQNDQSGHKRYHKSEPVFKNEQYHKSETNSITKVKQQYHKSETKPDELKETIKERKKRIVFSPKINFSELIQIWNKVTKQNQESFYLENKFARKKINEDYTQFELLLIFLSNKNENIREAAKQYFKKTQLYFNKTINMAFNPSHFENIWSLEDKIDKKQGFLTRKEALAECGDEFSLARKFKYTEKGYMRVV